MSEWKLTLQELRDAGGTAPGSHLGTRAGREWLLEHGLATIQRPRGASIYTITQLGNDVLDGRVVRMMRSPGGVRNGGPGRFVVTWLHSLPPPNQIRLSAAVPA